MLIFDLSFNVQEIRVINVSLANVVGGLFACGAAGQVRDQTPGQVMGGISYVGSIYESILIYYNFYDTG